MKIETQEDVFRAIAALGDSVDPAAERALVILQSMACGLRIPVSMAAHADNLLPFLNPHRKGYMHGYYGIEHKHEDGWNDLDREDYDNGHRSGTEVSAEHPPSPNEIRMIHHMLGKTLPGGEPPHRLPTDTRPAAITPMHAGGVPPGYSGGGTPNTTTTHHGTTTTLQKDPFPGGYINPNEKYNHGEIRISASS